MTAYRPELDGLRAVAILPVILFHLSPESLPGGFLGVDVFFVLSGYLITSKILPDIFGSDNATPFSLKQFFLRRIKRLMPASLVLVAVVQSFGGLLLLDSEWRLLSKQAVSTLPAVANIFFWWNTGDYWGPAAETMPLLHTWSLSVEEQFYLFFPCLLLLIRKTTSSSSVRLLILTSIATVSLASFVYCRRYYPHTGFFLAPFRAWELLAGCLLAELQRNKKTWTTPSRLVSNVCIVIGISTIVYGCMTGWGLNIITWRSALLTACGTLLVIQFATNPDCISQRILSLRPLVSVGLISYSLYLWHWPVIVYARFAGVDSQWAVLIASFILAILSYSLVERPARAAHNSVFFALLAGLITVTLGTTTFPYLLDRSARHVRPPEFLDGISLDPSTENPKYGSFQGSRFNGLPLFDANQFTADAVLFGDSHSIMFFPAVREVCERLNLRMTYFGAGGTSPFMVDSHDSFVGYGDWNPSERSLFDSSRISFLKRNRPRLVFICARWSLYSTAYYVWSPGRLRTHLEKLREHCGDAKCVFVGQPPELLITTDISTSGRIVDPALRVYRETASSRNQRREVHEQLKSFCNQNNDCFFIETDSVYAPSGIPVLLDNGQCLYVDGDHLSTMGAQRVVPHILERLHQIKF